MSQDWQLHSPRPDAYGFEVQEGSSPEGGPSTHFHSLEADVQAFGALLRYVESAEYLDKRLRLTGWVKTANVSDRAGLWLVSSGANPGAVSETNIMQDPRITGSTEWQRYQIELDVPAGATEIGYGAGLDGTGEIWFSGLALEPGPADRSIPPYTGSIYIEPDLIATSDPTTFQELTYEGRGLRMMFDRRVQGDVANDVSVHLFGVEFSDGKTAEILVNSEFGNVEAARSIALEYAPAIGRLPSVLRSGLDAVMIQQGMHLFGGLNGQILIHTTQATQYEALGILEEALVHEAVHAVLDSTHAAAPAWLTAQTADDAFISTFARDNPGREDVAASFLVYLALRHRSDRMSQRFAQLAAQTIGHRVAYFDAQDFDMHPID